MSTIEQIEKVSAPAVSIGRRIWVASRGEIETITHLAEDSARVGTLTGFYQNPTPLPQVGEHIALTGFGPAFFLGWLDTSDGQNLRALIVHEYADSPVEMIRPVEGWDARVVCAPGAAYLSDARTLELVATAWTATTAANTPDLGAEHKIVQARQQARQEAESIAHERLDEIVRDGHAWADKHDLCRVFDQFCEKHDLPVRDRECILTVRLEVELPVCITLSGPESDEDATVQFNNTYDEDDLLRMLRDGEIEMSEVTAMSRYVEDVDFG